MSQTGWKFVCSKCGEIAYGEEAPQVCPACEGIDTFVRAIEDEHSEE